MGIFKNTFSNRTDADMNLQGLWKHTQFLQRFNPDGFPVIRERDRDRDRVRQREALNLKQELSAIFLSKEELFFCTWVSLGILTTIKCGSMPRSRWPTQNDLNCMSVDIFYHINLYCISFHLICFFFLLWFQGWIP